MIDLAQYLKTTRMDPMGFEADFRDWALQVKETPERWSILYGLGGAYIRTKPNSYLTTEWIMYAPLADTAYDNAVWFVGPPEKRTYAASERLWRDLCWNWFIEHSQVERVWWKNWFDRTEAHWLFFPAMGSSTSSEDFDEFWQRIAQTVPKLEAWLENGFVYEPTLRWLLRGVEQALAAMPDFSVSTGYWPGVYAAGSACLRANFKFGVHFTWMKKWDTLGVQQYGEDEWRVRRAAALLSCLGD